MITKPDLPNFLSDLPYVLCSFGDLNVLHRHNIFFDILMAHSSEQWGPHYLIKIIDPEQVEKVFKTE